MGDLGRLRFMRTAGGLTHRNALRKKLQRVTVQRLVFQDDHKMLTDLEHPGDDWRRGGKLYGEKQGGAHWLANGHSYPASVTKATRLTIEVDLAIESADADPIECTITAVASLPAGDSGAPNAFRFETSVVLGGQPTMRLRLVATEPLADQLFLAADWTLQWTAQAAARTFDMGRTGPHRLYVTYGTPNPAGKPDATPWGDPIAPPLEDGITDKRMDAAVTLTEKQWRTALPVIEEVKKVDLDKNEPHDLVWALNGSVTAYTLQTDPAVPAQYKHPKYFKQDPGPWQGGAWPLTAHTDNLAECQAIVRMLRGLILQIGLPGQAHYVVVYAHEQVDGGKKALLDSVVPTDPDPSKYRLDAGIGKMMLKAGLSRDQIRVGTVNGAPTLQVLGLADRKVEPEQLLDQGTVLNQFEACLRYTHAGKTHFFGGGIVAHRFEEPEEVLKMFWGLVWTSEVPTATGVKNRVDQIVQIYQPDAQ